VKASGFRDWGAALGTDFKVPLAPMVKDTYDASKYAGVSFWAVANSFVQYVQIKFPDVNTDPEVSLADHCVLNAGFPNNCSPYLVKLDDVDFPNYGGKLIDRTWRQFKIYFADTRQDMYNAGRPGPGGKIDLAHLLGMAIQVNANYSTTPQTANDFELWIDDVEFFK
jgi:hypothetical protein